jgi:RNA polymerase sigma-70 factor (ECF subfamily)
VSETTLARARGGDATAFRELTEPYRRELQLHCYRLLGSLTDAEDAVQDTLLAAWRGLPAYGERASVRSWLYRIATNRCLNLIRDARRRPAAPVAPFEPPEPTARREATWLTPYPDALLDPESRQLARETVELAFVEALQLLPPRQAAVLVLVDVLDFSQREAARLLGTGETAVKGALQRARGQVARRRPRPGPATAGDAAVVARFAEAFVADDIGTLVALLTDDAWLSMPPAPHAYQGPDAIGAFWRASAAWRPGRLRLEPVGANGQPAFAVTIDGEAAGLLVLALEGGRVAAVHRFVDGGLNRRFAPASAPAPR